MTKQFKDINPLPHINKYPNQMVSQYVNLIEKLGRQVIWEKSIPCPCINPKTNSPRIDCPVCHGQGIVYTNSYMLKGIMQSDNKSAYASKFGQAERGTTVFTPQLTDNGVENGIAIRDRITLPDMTLSQTYLVNITSGRLSLGVFIPYNVNRIVSASAIINNALTDVTNKISISSNNILKVSDDSLLNHNISLNLEVQARYYIVNITKETRYTRATDYKNKSSYVGWYNKNLENYKRLFGDDINIKNMELNIRLPKLCIMRRESMFVPDTNINDSDINQVKLPDPTVSSELSDVIDFE